MGVIGPQHAIGKSVKAEWVVISPGHGKSESLSKLLQIDQRWSGIDADCLSTEEQLAGVAGGAGNSKHDVFLLRIGILETVVAHKTNGQRVGILRGSGVRNKSEALHVQVFPERRRALDRESRLFECQEPSIGKEFTSLCRVVIATTLIFGPVLGKPDNFGWPFDLLHLEAVVDAEHRNDGCNGAEHDQQCQRARDSRSFEYRSLGRCCDRLTMKGARLQLAGSLRFRQILLRQIIWPVARNAPETIKNALMDMNEVWNRPATA